MGYPTVRVEDIENAASPATAKREVDEALGIDSFGFNVYTVAPGERIPWGSHRHPDHEELFYVLDGELTVDTPDGSIRLGAGEAIGIPRNQPNCAHNAGEDVVRVVAAGAPKETDDAVIEEHCPACEAVTERRSERRDGGDTVVLFCTGCGAATDRFSR